MVSADQPAAFAAAAFALILIPGPSVLFAVGRALAYGHRRRAGRVPVQILLLSLVSFLIALVCDSAWSLLASTVRAWFAWSPRRLELIGGIGGLAMIGLGLSIAATKSNN
jgi:threonine/homoserine/homoserine lactone efflux protein